MPRPLRVAYTLEQCWHDVPGGTASAALRVAERLDAAPDVDLLPVAGRHRRSPHPSFAPSTPVRSLPIARPWLYEAWNRIGWPKVERATGPIDVCHSTVAIPARTDSPHVVTVHDVAFVHHPERFSRHGARVMRAGLDRCRSAALVLCPSEATAADLRSLGFDGGRIRIVPWGVSAVAVTDRVVADVRARFGLPEQFVLFVGTIEPRKNLTRLAAATSRQNVPLVVVGDSGWGDAAPGASRDIRFLGFVADDDLAALYAAADLMAYPSLEEGFGMPVLEAMAHGTPVVTSAGTATEEVAGGAAVLVEPTDVDSIASGLEAALADADALAERGRRRAAAMTWEATATATVAAYREVVR